MSELRSRVLEALLESLKLTQELSGRNAPEIHEDTTPFLDLDKFDSHNGVEVEILLSERLGVEIDAIPFHEGRRGSRELRVGEIVDSLIKKYGRKILAAQEARQAVMVTP